MNYTRRVTGDCIRLRISYDACLLVTSFFLVPNVAQSRPQFAGGL